MALPAGYAFDQQQVDKWRAIVDTQGFNRRMSSRNRNRGLQLYPGWFSDETSVLRAMRVIATEASKFPVVIDKTGVLGPDAIPGDFFALLTVAGYGMDQVSVPPVSNELIRSKLNLVTDFVTQRDRKIFSELVRLMFARSAPASVGIRRAASTGAPDYVNDMVKKKRELRHALSDLERFLNRVDRGELLELFLDFNAPLVATTGERWQPDKTVLVDGVRKSKDREVNDELAARSGLREGTRRPADKRVFVDGNLIEGHFAGRRRTVYGAPFVPNYVLAAFCSSWRAVYLDEYSFTWKHRTPDEILAKLVKFKDLMGFDVTQFDQTVPTFLIDAMCDELESYVDKRVVKLIRLMFKAPYIVPYPWVKGTEEEEAVHAFNPLFGDDPFDESSYVHELGLPSGIAINPDVGKLMMVFQYLVVLDRYFGDVLEVGIDRVLRGECERYGMLNMGDDCIVMFSDPAFRDWFKAGKFEHSLAYFSLEEESPISFLGNVPYRDDAGQLQLAPNVISFLVNWLAPEHGIDHHSRRNFWAVGERERRVHYARAPRFNEVRGIMEDAFRSVLGVNPSSIVQDAYQHQRRLMNLSTWDALVLQNPDYLHYKVDQNQISQEILDIIITSLPAEETWPVISRYTAKQYQYS